MNGFCYRKKFVPHVIKLFFSTRRIYKSVYPVGIELIGLQNAASYLAVVCIILDVKYPARYTGVIFHSDVTCVY